jgi:DNA modification methylase
MKGVVEKRTRINRLNNLAGKEWLKFTKSWFIHNPPPRGEKVLHPACFPEGLIEDFIKFFTKKGEWVLDPFLGTGSTLIAARNTSRNGVGLDVYPGYVRIAKRRILRVNPSHRVEAHMMVGDARRIVQIFEEHKLPMMDFCITSPPYWNQLRRRSLRQADRRMKGLDTSYGLNPCDMGNTEDYNVFIHEQRKVFHGVYQVIKKGGYLVVITNNIFFNGRLYPLAFDTLTSLSGEWVPKDERIWLQNDKALLPLGIYNAWVGNRHHQYCLILRKESESSEPT